MGKKKEAKKAKREAKQQRNVSAIANTSEGILDDSWLYPSETQSGIHVDKYNAQRVAAVYACIRNTAETIASLPCRLYRTYYEDDRKRSQIAFKHPLNRILTKSPNSINTRFAFVERIVEDLQIHGNHYSYISWASNGNVISLEPINYFEITPFWRKAEDGTRMKAYYYNPVEKASQVLFAGEVLHIMGPLQGDGLEGKSPIQLHRETIGYAIATRDYGARLFKNDARPRGVLQTEFVLSDDAMKRLEKNWQDKYGRHGNQTGVAVLEQGLTYNSLGMNNEDAQYIETRQFTAAEIAMIYRVPPHKIGIKSQMTLNNIEEQNREWLSDTIVPITERIISALDRDVLYAALNYEVRFNFAAYARGNVKDQTQWYKTGINWGYFSANDVLEDMGRNDIGPDGDKYYIPANMRSIDQPFDPAGAGATDDPENVRPDQDTPEPEDQR